VRRNSSDVIDRMSALIRKPEGPSRLRLPADRQPSPLVLRRTSVRSRLSAVHVRAVALLLGLALVMSVAYLVIGTPREEAIAKGAPDAVTNPPSTAMPAPAAVALVVHVAGDVQNPGVFALPLGSRVIDAIDAAGGVLAGADTTTVNLARLIEDGEQIVVGRTALQTSALLDLNTATIEELDRLPGVGPVIAQRIVAWRTEHGRFRTIDQLKDVSGVGAATFASLRKLIAVR